MIPIIFRITQIKICLYIYRLNTTIRLTMLCLSGFEAAYVKQIIIPVYNYLIISLYKSSSMWKSAQWICNSFSLWSHFRSYIIFTLLCSSMRAAMRSILLQNVLIGYVKNLVICYKRFSSLWRTNFDSTTAIRRRACLPACDPVLQVSLTSNQFQTILIPTFLKRATN